MPRVPKIDRKIEYFPIIGGEIKATNDQKGIVEGYLNYIGNIDYGDDRTMPGAFKRTLADSYARKAAQDLDYLWPYLWNHDYTIIPPGGIFEADEDRKGLYTKTQLNLDMQMGRELYSSFKMGTLKKQSMGYKAIAVDWVKETGKTFGTTMEMGYKINKFELVKENGRTIRNLLEVAVMEGSAVVFPMNDMAQVDTVKNRRNFYMPGKPLPTTVQEPPALTLNVHSKDYAESYMQTNQQDWVSDLWNLWYPLRNEIITAFQTGDSIEKDVQAALAQFAPAVLAYVQEGIALNMTECLQPTSGSDSMPMMMSADDNPETKEDKAGRVISAANHAKIKAAADGIKDHVATIHGVLRSASLAERQNTIAGTTLYGADDPVPEQKEEEKPEQKEEPFMDVHTALHDLSLLLSADNANRGL